MRLIKFLSAIFTTVFGWMWKTGDKKERVIGKLLSTSEGRHKLAAAMVEPRRCGGLEYEPFADLDVTKIRSGDKVVFANPQSGHNHDIATAKAARLKVGREYTVTEVDLGDFACRLRLEGWRGSRWSYWFNSVQFKSPAGLTLNQAAVKAEVDAFLDGGAPGTRIIHGPRRSGKTHLAHVIHRERGGLVVCRSHNVAEVFRQNHRLMFGKDANVATGGDKLMSTSNAVVVMDIDRKQYHEIRPYAAGGNNRVIYLHECSRIRDSLCAEDCG